MNYIIGISLGYNASACIMDEDQNVLYAASEERFTNIKNCKQFPLLAIKNGLKALAIDCDQIKTCRYSHYQDADIYDLYRHTYKIDEKISERKYPVNSNEAKSMEIEFIRSHLHMLGLNVTTIERINHHHAHAACAYNLTPFHNNTDNTNLYVVMDGFGDGESITAWVENETALKKIFSAPMNKSIALVYQFVTGALGYKEHQHEGKLTGLAAYGNPNKYYRDFVDIYMKFEDIPHDASVNSPIIDFDIFTEMKRRVYDFVNDILDGMDEEEKFEESKHIAASLQAFAEDTALEVVQNIMLENELTKVNVMLSGGLFANVKINQKIHENLYGVENLFVAPPMGDEGTCIGAACGYQLNNKRTPKMTNLTMRMGTRHTPNETRELLDDSVNFTLYYSIPSITKAIAKDLSENKIVCLFEGGLEFGPRALIGRSIMYNCRDVGANDWLNKQLGRTEFMPFAPFCKEEHANSLFYGVAGKEYALKNMTVTVDCRDEFVQNYPAACHIDQTARPQVISQTENELAWGILDEYEKITGEKALINTSFNLHNYPIIESPAVAIESWKKSNTDSLYIGNEWFCIRITRK